MDKIVIINSTPIIALSAIEKLVLLKELYGSVIIPRAVQQEIGVKRESKAQAQLELCADWINVHDINNIAQKQIFKTQLHDGEVEVMILGQEMKADLLIIDDYLARKYAKYLEFKVVGTAGVLLLAKSKGFIQEVRPLVDALVSNGIYISSRLYSEIMSIAGE